MSDAASTLKPTDLTAVEALARLEELQAQLESVREELTQARRRDETLNRYMQQVDEEMRLAARLQRDFLPKSLPIVGRARFHTLFRPAGYVSGDLYDVMRLDETHVGFYMADAVGHGMPAALLTMFLKNALLTKEITPAGYRLLQPSQTMARLNDALIGQELAYATFATAVYGTVNGQTGVVTMARGGHPTPLIQRADGRIECPEVDGSLLGVFEGEQFPDRQFELGSGDRLIVYSDGIEVVFGGDEALDAAQWRAELEARRHLDGAALIADFTQRLEAVTGSIMPKDDLTIIVIEMG